MTFTNRQKKIIKVYFLFCIIIGLVLGIKAGYRKGKKDKEEKVKTEISVASDTCASTL